MLLAVLPWVLFLGFVGVMLALDLGVFHRHAHAVSRREALAWSGVWIGLAALFNLGVYLVRGTQDGLEWTTGYLIEKSLSVDNVFVFLLIFSTFAVPAAYQHRVLFWGIVGALLMRAVLILVGAALLESFHWIIYLFGAFLIVTGLKFLRGHTESPSLETNRLVRLAKRLMPTTDGYVGQRFFTRWNGVLYMTPLFLVLLLIESTDLVFAVDSIPAIYAVTDDPFIVFTSNIFAILGLRALYFVLSGYLAGLRARFNTRPLAVVTAGHEFADERRTPLSLGGREVLKRAVKYLKPALAAVLVFVGSKMLLVDVYKIPALTSLGVIVAILSVAIGASVLVKRRDTDEHEDADEHERGHEDQQPADPAACLGLPAQSMR